ncbi:hypothetical protein [Prescottella agglutinans]|uniref:Uncharacterized protein n=1 Tax=Prescottella agglutinans TaxID=1644129 RepID=A0ABT6MI73_9NOCA|nr:hypothetical protein [Prescottella agglutinans]MDH6284014.1 hypothetical protein [Prescottella agglutinans]
MRTRVDPIHVDLLGTGDDVDTVVTDIFALPGSDVLTLVDRSTSVDEWIADTLHTQWLIEHPGDVLGQRAVHTVTFDVESVHLDRMAELIADMLARAGHDAAGAVVADPVPWVVRTQRAA